MLNSSAQLLAEILQAFSGFHQSPKPLLADGQRCCRRIPRLVGRMLTWSPVDAGGVTSPCDPPESIRCSRGSDEAVAPVPETRGNSAGGINAVSARSSSVSELQRDVTQYPRHVPRKDLNEGWQRLGVAVLRGPSASAPGFCRGLKPVPVICTWPRPASECLPGREDVSARCRLMSREKAPAR